MVGSTRHPICRLPMEGAWVIAVSCLATPDAGSWTGRVPMVDNAGEQVPQLFTFLMVERGQERAGGLAQLGGGGPLPGTARVGELDFEGAPVVWASDPAYQAGPLQVVEQVDHCGPVDRQRVREFDLGERSGLDQRAEHAPAARGQTERFQLLGRERLRGLRCDEEELADAVRAYVTGS